MWLILMNTCIGIQVLEKPVLRDYFMDKITSNSKMIRPVILKMEMHDSEIWVNDVLVYLDTTVTGCGDKYYHTLFDKYA